MVRSMTAFARGEETTEDGEFAWEIRSVNHRYLELSLRLPEQFRSEEQRFRKLVSDHVKRGKVDATLRFQANDTQAEIEPDFVQIARLAKAIAQVGEHLGGVHTAGLSALDILRWPGVLRQPGTPDQARLNNLAHGLLVTCVEKLVAMRGGEGESLAATIRERLDSLQAQVDLVESHLPAMLKRLRERLRERLAELLERLDAERIEQEVVLAAQKMDVAEEIDRLRIHVKEVRETLNRDEAVGRRLDFLMQELNRETNTIASKSADAAIAQVSIDMKVNIEQMREQVQNIE